MVKSGKSRIEKWKAKLSGENRKRLYDAQKEMMVRLETKASRDFEKIELFVKNLVQGQPIIYLPYYMIFAKEIYKRQKKFTGQTLLNELIILDYKWEQRGLNGHLLDQIKAFYVEAYASIIPFRLDISELDGPDILS